MGQQYSDAEKQAIATVAASTYRQRVLAELVDKAGTPGQLAEKTEIAQPHVSRALGDLQEVECVELLVAEGTQKGRVYRATERGETVQEVVGDE